MVADKLRQQKQKLEICFQVVLQPSRKKGGKHRKKKNQTTINELRIEYVKQFFVNTFLR